jgi:OOP family OmpA-OmpF porin
MNNLHVLSLMSLALLGAAFAPASQAQESSYFFGGIGVGKSKAHLDEEQITADRLGAGQTVTDITRDAKETAYRAFGGYQFNRYFGLEAGYFSLGKFGFTSTVSPAGSLEGRVKVQGIALDAVGTFPMTQKLSAIARVGTHYAKVIDSFNGTGSVVVASPHASNRSMNYKYGAGLQYEVTPAFFVRGEAEQYRVNDAVGHHAPINVLSMSLVFPFGRSAAPVRSSLASTGYSAPAYEPAPVAVAPAPAPVVMAAAVAAPPVAVVPERKRVSFSAESLFTFDDSTVRPEGRAALDAFARESEGTQFEMIIVEGHTDRVGTPAYNQDLSLRRAEAVKSYLVTSGHFDPAKIAISGKGESQPMTKAGDCTGEASAKLIICLQADRRVEIGVTGTR